MKANQKFLKVIAVILPFITAITFLIMISIMEDIDRYIEYNSYYSYEITEASAEKQEDGRYLITAVIKNNSSYQTVIDKNSVQITYGNNSRLENQIPLYENTDLYETLNKTFLPAGQSVEFPILVELPEEVHSVTLSCYGDSYDLRKFSGNDDPKLYKLTLK